MSDPTQPAGPLLLNQLVKRLSSPTVDPEEASAAWWERLGLTALQWELILAGLLGLSALVKVR